MSNEKMHSIIGELDSTDNSLMELSDTVAVLAQGIRDSGDGQVMENVLLHILGSLRDIRAQLDETMAAVMQESHGSPAV